MKYLRLLLSFTWLTLYVLTLPSARSQEPYKLTAGDTVELKFFYNPELNETIQIRPDGTVSLALIGEMQLSGKTPAEASAEIRQRYRNIVKDPSNTLQIQTYGSRIVYVGGEVTRPGPVPQAAKLTVMEALLYAGGVKHTGANYVMLIRQDEHGVPVARRISINGHGGVPEAAVTQLRSFDVLLLPESKIAHVDRWVDQYIKQVLPGTLNGGFSYLFNGIIASNSGVVAASRDSAAAN
ncbi:MAG TPA: polysaccharide biosynthesis/export family protein [Acidobacteriaceae bacterium]